MTELMKLIEDHYVILFVVLGYMFCTAVNAMPPVWRGWYYYLRTAGLGLVGVIQHEFPNKVVIDSTTEKTDNLELTKSTTVATNETAGK